MLGAENSDLVKKNCLVDVLIIMGAKNLLFVSCYAREPLMVRFNEYDVLIGQNKTH